MLLLSLGGTVSPLIVPAQMISNTVLLQLKGLTVVHVRTWLASSDDVNDVSVLGVDSRQ